MQNTNDILARSYNDIPYTSNVFFHCQPERLHAIAKIKGLNPPDIQSATILEIGCSFGGNLVPFAIRNPNSYSIGIDLSEEHVNTGNRMLKEIGVDNVQLICADISKVNFENVYFDYIICHGVFSWVPASVQDAILSTIKNNLTPNGIAFISYNTYPGWHIQDFAKSFMQFSSNPNLDIISRTEQAFKAIEFTQDIFNRFNAHFHKEINTIFSDIISRSKFYVAHEYFESHNTPFYFKKFIEKTNNYDLSYLADSDRLSSNYDYIVSSQEYEKICEYFNYIEDIEQYFDFITNRKFRCSILTHKKNILDTAKENLASNIEKTNNIDELYFKCDPLYIKTGEKEAYWSINNSIKIPSTSFSDTLFKYLNNKIGFCAIKDLKSIAQSHEEYNEEDFKYIIDKVIYCYRASISFYPIEIETYTNKPLILEKNRNLIRFIENNPNITTLSNHQSQIISLDSFTVYISRYLDGHTSILDLANIVRNGIENHQISFRFNGKEIPISNIKDEEINHIIHESLQILYTNGFFST